jgi:hypothetical protein
MSSVHVPTIGKEEMEKKRPGKRFRDEFQKNLSIIGKKRHAGNCQRWSGVEEDFIGRRGVKWTTALKKKKVMW